MGENELNILQIILESGFVVKSVLFMLLFSSIVSWAVVFLKRRVIKELEKNNRAFLKVYKESRSLRDMLKAASSLSFSPYKAIFISGHKELEKIKKICGSGRSDEELRIYFDRYGLNAVERAMKKGRNEVNIRLNKFLSLLASIGSVTPFVGLFGTVWGIIDSFTGLASGGATLDAVAPGIAEALVATAVGLAAAIPAVWFYNHYNNVNGRINLDLNSFEQEFLNSIQRSLV